MFLCVPESNGSSPGRKGFKMAVTKNELQGSIGGGIMEHKFVAYAKELLYGKEVSSILKKQVHSKESMSNQSGMICSGDQTIALYKIQDSDQSEIEKIIAAIENQKSGYFTFSPNGIIFYDHSTETISNSFQIESENQWHYIEMIGFKNYLFIIGAGHVSLAFSRIMQLLDFHISVFDDRENLNTFEQNNFVHHKKIIDFENIIEEIGRQENQYVVIMTFGYRTDGIVIRKLINENYKYLGLLGSKTKVAKIVKELRSEGFDESKIKALFAPVGLAINSRTPEEIAVSIAAEIIKVKNDLNPDSYRGLKM